MIKETPGIDFKDYIPPSWDVYFMRLCYEVSYKSKDPSSKFGAVIVKENRPILFGYNGLPPKVKDYPERLERPIKYKWINHAETNAIACGAKFGIETNGTILYIPAYPCAGCARIIISAGIKKIVMHDPAVKIFSKVSLYGEDDEISKQMFKESEIDLFFLNEVVDKVAYLGGKQYKV